MARCRGSRLIQTQLTQRHVQQNLAHIKQQVDFLDEKDITAPQGVDVAVKEDAPDWDDLLGAVEGEEGDAPAELKERVEAINAKHNVEGLCWRLPDRVADLNKRKGDRLSK